jgi:hypothetical protein
MHAPNDDMAMPEDIKQAIGIPGNGIVASQSILAFLVTLLCAYIPPDVDACSRSTSWSESALIEYPEAPCIQSLIFNHSRLCSPNSVLSRLKARTGVMCAAFQMMQ